MVYNRLKKLHSWLFPAQCILCQTTIPARGVFCSDCSRELPAAGPGCPRCAGQQTHPGVPCGQCQQRPPAFHQVLAPFRYQPPVDRLIQALKYRRRLDFALDLGGLLGAYVQKTAANLPEIIVPVPLHRSRLRQRGFNQSLELARPIARLLDLPLDYQALTRVRATAAQSQLSPKQRLRNVKNAFTCDPSLAGKRVALVDDVMTTGATVDAVATTLKKAGVRVIQVWIVARA